MQMNALHGTYHAYFSESGKRVYNKNRIKSGKKFKLLNVKEFLIYAEYTILKNKWSPDSIVGYVLKHNIFSKDQIVSIKTLYNYIDSKFLNVQNIHLCDIVKRKSKTNKNMPKTNIRKFGKSIDSRDPIVKYREELGHWEIDLVILRKTNSEALLTLVERKTRKFIVEVLKIGQQRDLSCFVTDFKWIFSKYF